MVACDRALSFPAMMRTMAVLPCLLCLLALLPLGAGERRLVVSTVPDAKLQPLFDPPHARQPWPPSHPAAAPPSATTTTAAAGFEWLGGDCASSLRLPSRGPNATLWLFGDTLLGTMMGGGGGGGGGGPRLRRQRGCVMPHQSYALQQGQGALRYAWKSDAATGAPLSIFEASAGQPTLRCAEPFDDLAPYYWVVQGIDAATVLQPQPGVAQVDKLLLLAVRVAGTPGVGLGFKVLGTTAIVVSNPATAADPSEWQYTAKDMTTCGDDPSTCEQWTTAIAPAPATADCTACVYLVGQPGPTTAKAQIMRSPLSALLELNFSSGEILCSDGQWRPRLPGAPLPPMAQRMGLFDQQPSTTLVFHPFLNKWLAAATNAFAGKEILLWSTEGSDVAGPWRSEVMYTLPLPYNDGAEVFCYAVKIHPHLIDRPDELVTTVMSNAFNMSVLFGDVPNQQHNFGGNRIYTPYVLRTTLAAPVPGAAAASTAAAAAAAA